MSIQLDAQRLLVKAHDILSDPKHWVQGVEREGDGFCSLGAIKEAWMLCDRNRISIDALEYAKGLLRSSIYLQVGHRVIAHYNDNPDRTHTEILHVFDDAIERSRSNDPSL